MGLPGEFESFSQTTSSLREKRWERPGCCSRLAFTRVKDGFETQHVDQKVPTPWHSWPGIDFFTENLWPFEVKDSRRFTYTLQPKQAVNENDALNRAEVLRARGRSLQSTGSEAPPPIPGMGPAVPGPTQPPVGGTPGTVPLPPITSGSDGASR